MNEKEVVIPSLTGHYLTDDGSIDSISDIEPKVNSIIEDSGCKYIVTTVCYRCDNVLGTIHRTVKGINLSDLLGEKYV